MGEGLLCISQCVKSFSPQFPHFYGIAVHLKSATQLMGKSDYQVGIG